MIDWLYRVSLNTGVALLLLSLLAVVFARLSPSIRCWLWRAGYLKCLASMAVAATISVPLIPASPVVSQVLPPFDKADYSIEPEAMPLASAPTEALAPLQVPETKPIFTLERVILWLYLVGAAVALFRWCQALIKARRLWRSAQPVSMPETAVLAERLRLRQVPQIARHAGLSSPLYTFGGILLPESASSGESLALAHELAHARRKDLPWEVFGSFIQVMLWYHPLVLWARRQERLAQEQAADALVLQVCGVSSAEYARTLLAVATGKPVSALAIGVLEKPSLLRLRIAALGKPALSVRKACFQATCLTLFAVLALLPWRAVARQSPKPWFPANTTKHQPSRIHSGRVQTSYREPIEGAKVTLLQRVKDGWERSTTFEGGWAEKERWVELDSMYTGADGTFRWNRPYAADAIQVSATGFGTTRRTDFGGDGGRITLWLAVRLEAIVTDENGKPFAGKRIISVNGDTGLTDSQGRFVIPDAQEPGGFSRPLFQLAEPGWVLERLDASKTDGVITHRMVAFRGQRIKGKVVDSAGQPVSGAMVGFAPYELMTGQLLMARTDGNGNFQSPLLPPGAYMAKISAGKELAAKQIPYLSLTDTAKPILVTLTPGVLVRGKVTNKNTGKPLPGVQLNYRYPWYQIKNGQRVPSGMFSAGSATVEATGEYLLRLPSDLVCNLSLEGRAISRHALQESKKSVSGREGESIVRNFALWEKETLAGQVVDEQGHPISGATLFHPNSWQVEKVGVTDQHGQFAIPEDRLSGPLYILQAKKGAGRAEWRGIATSNPIRLVLKSNQAVTVHGRVLEDLSNRTVEVSARQLGGGDYRKIPVDSKGQFSLTVEPDIRGWLDIKVSGFGRVRSTLPATPRGRTIDLGGLRLPVANTTITGRLLDEQGQPARNIRMIVFGEYSQAKAVFSSDGTFKVSGLVATDRWQAAISKHGASRYQWLLTLPPGKRDGIELRLTDSATRRRGQR